MAFPVVSLSTIFGGAFVSGLVSFVASKMGMVLAGLGLTFIGVKGFETLLGFVVADLNTILGSAAGIAHGVTGLGSVALQVAAYVGLFDAFNIVIAGYMSFVSLVSVRFLLGRLGK